MDFLQRARRRRFTRLVGMSLAVFCLTLTAAVRGASSLSVDYHAPRLSIDAFEVSLAAVLSAIGAQVGFSVVETAPSSTVVTLSITDATLDDALRQLLRAENHTVLYRSVPGAAPGDVKIDRIVLLGEPGVGNPVVAGLDPAQARDPLAHGDGGGALAPTRRMSATSPEVQPDSAPSVPWDRVAAWDRAPAPGGPGDLGTSTITVGDLLKTQAIAATAPGAQSGGSAAPPLAAGTPHANLDVPLADATRRAQQGLGALLDGLAAATRSLYESRAQDRK